MSPKARFRFGHVRIENETRPAHGIAPPPAPSPGGGQGRGIGQGEGGGRGVKGGGGGQGRGVGQGVSLPPGLLANALVVLATKPGFTPAAARATYRDTVLASVPTGYWKLDDTGGALTAVDSSGNGFGATLQGSPTQGVAPLINSGTAMTFNGTTQAGQTSRNVFMPAKTGHISLEAWIKTSGSAGDMDILSADDIGFIRYFDWQLLSTGKISALLFSGGVGTAFTFNNVITNNVRHHLLFSYDGTTGHLWIDSVEDGTGIAGTNKFESGGNGTFATCVGKRNSSGSDTLFFSGTLDECAVYERVLTQADATAHWLAGK